MGLTNRAGTPVARLVTCLLVLAACVPSVRSLRTVQIDDEAAFARASTRLLERLSIGDQGGRILSVEDALRTIAGRCQRERAFDCADEALEMYLTSDRGEGLNFKYNQQDKRVSTVVKGIRALLRDVVCMHIWDGQRDAPDRNMYKAYVAVCDKEWAQRGDTLQMQVKAQRTAVAQHFTPTFMIESVSKPGSCLSRNPVDEYLKFLPCNAGSNSQLWFLEAFAPYSWNDIHGRA